MRETITEFAQAIPAALRLVFRVVRDDRIDQRRRAAVLAAAGYAILPFDLIPDRIPFIGKADDVVIVAAALQAVFEAAGDDIVREHWEGSEASLEALLSLVELIAGFLPRPARRLFRL